MIYPERLAVMLSQVTIMSKSCLSSLFSLFHPISLYVYFWFSQTNSFTLSLCLCVCLSMSIPPSFSPSIICVFSQPRIPSSGQVTLRCSNLSKPSALKFRPMEVACDFLNLIMFNRLSDYLSVCLLSCPWYWQHPTPEPACVFILHLSIYHPRPLFIDWVGPMKHLLFLFVIRLWVLYLFFIFNFSTCSLKLFQTPRKFRRPTNTIVKH